MNGIESFRIEKKDIYKIEVNDKGECIEFDLLDLNLKFKCLEALDKIEKIKKHALMQESIIKKREDVKGKYLTRNQEDILQLYKETFQKMREAMDLFLGEGACQKIFGDRNYIEMFDDLFEQLEPHLKKIDVSMEGISKRISEKYSKNKRNVI